MFKLKTNKTSGITLVALVVTIIVLLILTGVSIMTITGNNGILQRASDAKEKTEIEKVIELAKMDILNQLMENRSSLIKKTQLVDILKKYFDNVDNLELPDDLSNTDIKLNANKNYGGYKDIELSRIYSDKIDSGNMSTICLGNKNIETVDVGDDLTVGIRKIRASNLEKFKIIKKEGNIITAIPYYNIEIKTDNPVQCGIAENSRFSKSKYVNDSIIDMDNENNVIKDYIAAYQSTLELYGAKKVKTRVPLYSDVSTLTAEQRNPSGNGEYWLGTAFYASGLWRPAVVFESTIGSWDSYTDNRFGKGVRPIVEFDMSGIEYFTDENDTLKFKSPNEEQKLIELICNEDYGKNIDYSVEINGQTLDNWKVFLNDNNNVYIIYGDYLEASLMPDSSDVNKNPSTYKYNVWSAREDANYLHSWLNNENIWSEFAGGVTGATAKGGPTLAQLSMSFNRKLIVADDISGSLYIVKNEQYENCSGYWLNEYYRQSSSSNYIRYVNYQGKIYDNECGTAKNYSVRPIVCLPSDTLGKIEGDIVYIVKN